MRPTSLFALACLMFGATSATARPVDARFASARPARRPSAGPHTHERENARRRRQMARLAAKRAAKLATASGA